MNRSNEWYPLNEDIYASLVCLDKEEARVILNYLRKKGSDSREIVTESIATYAMLTLLTDEDRIQMAPIMQKVAAKLQEEIDKMVEGENEN